MKPVSVVILLLCGAMPAIAQERHPTVQKVIEIAVSNHVVRAKCPRLSINPQLVALAVMAVGFAGRQGELDAVKEDEILALAEAAKQASQMTSAECGGLSSQAIPDPLDASKTMPVFVTAE